MTATRRRALGSRPVLPAVLLLSVVLSGCGTAGASPTTTGTSTALASPSATTARATTFAGFREAFCAAWTSIFTATGNPDTGSGSDLTLALGAAVDRADTSAIADLGARIRAELERGRAHAAAGAGWAPGAGVMEQTDHFIVALEASIDAQVAAAAQGSAAAKQAAQAAFEKAGGLAAWSAMFAAAGAVASARPADEPTRSCPAIPMSI